MGIDIDEQAHRAFYDRLASREYRRIELPEPYFQGDHNAFCHTDKDVERFWHKFPFNRWEWYGRVWFMERDAGATFEEFVANILAQAIWSYARPLETDRFRVLEQNPRLRYDTEFAKVAAERFPGMAIDTPARVFFAIFACDTLCWVWPHARHLSQRLSDLGLTRSQIESATWLVQKLDPRCDEEDAQIMALLADELVPPCFKNVPDTALLAAIAEIVAEDLRELASLCARHGTLAESLLPGAFDPVIDLYLYEFDYQDQICFLSTRARHYGMRIQWCSSLFTPSIVFGASK